MAGSRSFMEYVAQRFEDPIFDAIADYIAEADFDSLDLRIHRLHEIGECALSEIRAKTIYVYDQPGMRVGFDLAVEADIEVQEGSYRYDEPECTSQWFLVKCSGDLDKDLDDFAISSVEIYDRRPQHDKPLYGDTLVPVMFAQDYERRAQEFFEANYRKALLNNGPVDPKEIADAMGLDVKERSISEDCSIFGQIYFRNVDTVLYNDKTGEMEPVHVDAKTILVDPRTYFLFNLGKVANTIIHECCHYHFHRKAFELERLWNNSASVIGCKVIGGVEGFDNKYVSIMERQANALASHIQMPLVAFKRQAQKRIKEAQNATGLHDYIDIMELVIKTLATDFGVSTLAAKIRMIEIDYYEAVGTFNFVDGHYVKPFTFRKNFLKQNQTFTISAEEAAYQRLTNPELRKLTDDGDYIFVDNHYVYNTPQYVQPGEDGELELTPYALRHMDECCLVFDMKIVSNVDSQYYTECYLNREESNITFEVTFHNGYENAPPERQIAYRRQLCDEARSILRQMTEDPEQCMKVLLDWRGMTYVELADAIGVNERTIRRTVKGETAPNVKTAALICFGLNLPPLLSAKLLSVLGCPLQPFRFEAHQWIDDALHTKYPEPVPAVKRYLADVGVEL